MTKSAQKPSTPWDQIRPPEQGPRQPPDNTKPEGLIIPPVSAPIILLTAIAEANKTLQIKLANYPTAIPSPSPNANLSGEDRRADPSGRGESARQRERARRQLGERRQGVANRDRTNQQVQGLSATVGLLAGVVTLSRIESLNDFYRHLRFSGNVESDVMNTTIALQDLQFVLENVIDITTRSDAELKTLATVVRTLYNHRVFLSADATMITVNRIVGTAAAEVGGWSEKLRASMKEQFDKGGSIRYGEPGKGSWLRHDYRGDETVLDPGVRIGRPTAVYDHRMGAAEAVVYAWSHETGGHVHDEGAAVNISLPEKEFVEKWVQEHLRNEARADLRATAIWRETRAIASQGLDLDIGSKYETIDMMIQSTVPEEDIVTFLAEKYRLERPSTVESGTYHDVYSADATRIWRSVHGQ